MKESIKTFFNKTPALFYALFLLFGSLLALEIYSPLVPASLLFYVFKNKQRMIFLLLMASAFLLVKSRYTFPQKEITGIARISLTSIREAKYKGFVYKGVIKEMIPDGEEFSVASCLPCSFFSPLKQECNQDYLVHGILREGKGKYYFLKSKEEWIPIDHSKNLVSLRYDLKKRMLTYLKKQIADSRVAGFLSGLATGELRDDVLLKAFEKRGLSHLLAISGFHFAMIALTFHSIFRIFLPPKWNAALLMLLLTSYFLFIGNSPSVMRAWIIACVALVGLLIEKRANGINSLGIALMISLLFNPLNALNAGFQLSYLATAGILFLFSPLKILLRPLFPKTDNFVMNFCRDSLALGLAVHVAIFPHLLHLFHKMPWHGLFYNFFFPALVTLSLIGLILGCLFHLLIPPLGLLVHKFNAIYTGMVLRLMEIPLCPHKTLYVEKVPPLVLTLYLTLVFGGAILLRSYFEKREEEDRLEFCFF